MKTDIYTKAVLTGIQLCLVWLCVVVTPIGTPLTAQAPNPAAAAPVQDVRIIGVKQPEMARPVGGTARPVSGDWDALPTYGAQQAQPSVVR